LKKIEVPSYTPIAEPEESEEGEDLLLEFDDEGNLEEDPPEEKEKLPKLDGISLVFASVSPA
jgi:hypothetical protein